MATAKQLDALKAKVESKQAELEKVQGELDSLQLNLQEMAEEFIADYGIKMPTAKSPAKVSQVSTASNAKAKAVITKLIGKKKSVEIKKPEKEQIAQEAGCTVKEVEVTLKNEFQGLPLGKGRKSTFGLKV